jgi:hypothetical protein
VPIQLSAEEAALLKELLQSALGEIKVEIRHTETSAFRKTLHEKEDKIRELLARL